MMTADKRSGRCAGRPVEGHTALADRMLTLMANVGAGTERFNEREVFMFSIQGYGQME